MKSEVIEPTGCSHSRVQPSSVEALKKQHSTKRQQTAAKLEAAIQRMNTGHTLVLKKGFRWTKRSLAAEAGVHLNTLIAKDDGGFVYSKAFNLFELSRARLGSRPQGRDKILLDKMRLEIADLVREREMLTKQLKDSDNRIIEERNRMLQFQLENEALRERLTKAGLLNRP